MRKSLLVLAVAVVLVLTAAQATAGGPWKVTPWQNGVPTSTATAGQSFQLRGEGFHNRVHPVKICITGSYCTLANIDQKGDFMDVRMLQNPGTYTVTVLQAKNPKLLDWVERASCEVTVEN